MDTAKTQKKMQKIQLNNSLGANVFTNSVPNFWGVGKNMFAENPMKIVVSAYFEKKRKKGPKM